MGIRCLAFIDADGYITITKRGEPRVGIIATGERGKVHCEELQKTLGCGVLQLDLKLYQKSSKRSQHRLQFYSKADVRKVLKGVEPHLRLKKNQLNNVLEYIDTPRKGAIAKQRRDQLEKLVKYDNWSDKKGDELLSEWGVKEEDIMTWRDPTLMQLELKQKDWRRCCEKDVKILKFGYPSVAGVDYGEVAQRHNPSDTVDYARRPTDGRKTKTAVWQ